MSGSKQIKIGAVLSYVSIALNIVAGLIYTPWMIDQIGDSDYGLYTLANSLITLFIVDFGLGSAVSRYVSKYRAECRQDKVDNFLGAVYKLYLIIDAIVFIALVVVFFCLESIYVKLTPAELEKFKIVYIISGLFAVVNFPFVTLNGIINAYEKFIQLKLADIIYRILLVGTTVVALLFGYGLYALVATHAIVGILIILYKLIVIKRSVPVKVNFKHAEKGLYKEIFSFSIWITISLLAQRLVFNITPSILGVVASTAAIAVFGVITTIEGYAYTITNAINGMFMPRIAKIYADGNAEKNITPLFLGVGKFQYALNGLIVAGFAVVGRSFINLWVGPDYSSAYYGILLVIIPGLFFNSLHIANTAMVVQKKVNVQACVGVIVGVANVILSFVLSSYFGVVGAAASIFAVYMLRAVLYNIIYYKVLKFDIPRFIRECYLRMSVPIIVSVAAGFLMNYFVGDGGWLVLVAKGFVTVVIYLLTVLFVGLNREEKNKIISKMRRK